MKSESQDFYAVVLLEIRFCFAARERKKERASQDMVPRMREDLRRTSRTHRTDKHAHLAKSKKQRQRAAKALRKRALQNPESLTPKVPLYEQSVDLPGGGDGSLEAAKEAGQARSGLTKAMRDKRRKAIKEDNFLRAMG